MRARLLPLDEVLAKTYDPYAFIRSAFDQRRRFQIYDGDVPEELLEQDDASEDWGDTGDEATDDAPPAEPPPDAAEGSPAPDTGPPPQAG
jgi:phospholipid-binding lipoprotein MlaA